MAFVPRLLNPGRDHFFLLGPRGTGKTSWCAHQFPNALRIDLLDPATLRPLSAQPERLAEMVAAAPKKQIVIDEIQKLPELLEVVHLLIERKTGQQFILTGSTARKLRRHGVNLLGGRAAQKHLHPYMAAELRNQFKLDLALRQGMLPIVWAADDRQAILEAYNGLYLREEVQMEGLVRNIGSFARFLEAMSSAHAAVLNLAAVSRDCHVSRKTAEGYLEILEDLLLGFRLEVFSRRAKRAIAAHPKFYFFDAGIFRVTVRADPSIHPRSWMGPRSRAWSRNTCAPGATTPPGGINCTIGRPARKSKWTSSSTATPAYTPWRSRVPVRFDPRTCAPYTVSVTITRKAAAFCYIAARSGSSATTYSACRARISFSL